ncbi:hypothetical protein [Pseudomonas sp. AE27]|uniref:hypothetical protein n=1 Tax=Pseudomonas sp. AE27 TaxID=3127460 RepID=UPI0030CB49BF
MRAKRKEGEVAEATALPAEVLAALDGASVYVRQPGEDGEPRVVVQPAGMKGWVHGDDNSERLSRMFPELTEAHLQRATRYLSSIVRNHLRKTGGNGAKVRKNWVHSW